MPSRRFGLKNHRFGKPLGFHILQVQAVAADELTAISSSSLHQQKRLILRAHELERRALLAEARVHELVIAQSRETGRLLEQIDELRRMVNPGKLQAAAFHATLASALSGQPSALEEENRALRKRLEELAGSASAGLPAGKQPSPAKPAHPPVPVLPLKAAGIGGDGAAAAPPAPPPPPPVNPYAAVDPFQAVTGIARPTAAAPIATANPTLQLLFGPTPPGSDDDEDDDADAYFAAPFAFAPRAPADAGPLRPRERTLSRLSSTSGVHPSPGTRALMTPRSERFKTLIRAATPRSADPLDQSVSTEATNSAARSEAPLVVDLSVERRPQAAEVGSPDMDLFSHVYEAAGGAGRSPAASRRYESGAAGLHAASLQPRVLSLAEETSGPSPSVSGQEVAPAPPSLGPQKRREMDPNDRPLTPRGETPWACGCARAEAFLGGLCASSRGGPHGNVVS